MKKRQTASKPFYKWLRVYAIRNLRSIILLSLISVSGVLFELLEPWPIKVLVDSGFGNVAAPSLLSHLSKPHLIVFISLSFIVIYGLESVMSLVQTLYLHQLMFRFDFTFISSLFDKIQNLPMQYISNKQVGDYAYRLNSEAGDVSQLIFDVTNSIIASGFLVLGILVVMARIDFVLALIALCVVPILYISIRRFTPRIEEQSRKVEVSTSDLYSYTSEAIENIQLIQSYNYQKKQLGFIERFLKRNFIYQMKYLVTNEQYSLVNDIVATAAMALLVVLGADRVYAKGLTVGDLLVFLTYLSYLYSPLQTISDSVSEARGYFATTRRVYELYGYNRAIPEVQHPKVLKNVKGKIEFEHVSATYGRHKVLSDVDLIINPGEKVGIIGRSGEGKTTLLNLLPRFYQSSHGLITLDSIPIDDVSLSNLRDQFAIVSQNSPMFNTTILNNLRLARSSHPPSAAEITRALKNANAYEFVRNLPDGLQTVIGERGKLLSGGQRQRIAIARAFLRDAPVLLLDEPSTGLDLESVEVILSALQTLMANRTTLIISHSLEMLKHTDSIYLLDKGRVVAKTTYAALINDFTNGNATRKNELTIFRESMFDQTAPL